MKTLANCNAVDFLTQTNKIRKAVAKWLTDTDILNIRKNVPEMPQFKPLEYPKDVSDDEKEKLFDEYQKEREKVLEGHEKAKREQVKKNLMEMLDKALDEFPMETLEILGMVCLSIRKTSKRLRASTCLTVRWMLLQMMRSFVFLLRWCRWSRRLLSCSKQYTA